MRGVAVLLLLAFPALAGCSSPEPAAVDGSPRRVTVPPVVLAEGTFRWHGTGGGAGAVLEAYELASQAVAHPCVWDGPNGREVYFNNLHLPTGRASQGLGPWSGNLTLTVDWTDQDWIGMALRVAYQAPGVAGWHETAPIERASALTVPIRVAPTNASAAEDEGAAVAAGWSVWLCLPSDTGTPESPFLGSVRAQAVFAPDPVLESELPPDEDAPGRTARGGVPTQPAL